MAWPDWRSMPQSTPRSIGRRHRDRRPERALAHSGAATGSDFAQAALAELCSEDATFAPVMGTGGKMPLATPKSTFRKHELPSSVLAQETDWTTWDQWLTMAILSSCSITQEEQAVRSTLRERFRPCADRRWRESNQFQGVHGCGRHAERGGGLIPASLGTEPQPKKLVHQANRCLVSHG